MQVQFLTGTQESYDSMSTRDSGTFYYTGTNVYLGDILLSNSADVAAALAAIANNTEAIEELGDKIGNLDDLNTTSKSDIVSAINEVYVAIGTGGTASVVTIEESSSDSYAKVYTVYQGGSSVGVINIPKDLVVESGDVEINPAGQPRGTYIVLTLANTNNQKIYIDVADLVDIYTAQQNATQVQLTVNGTEISAVIVAGSIGTTELANSAVTTAKIADSNVTKAKLSSEVQYSLNAADSAVQSVTSGVTNGTILVDGVSVNITGLGTAAYEDADAFDAAGAADTALTAAKEYTDSCLTWQEM